MSDGNRIKNVKTSQQYNSTAVAEGVVGAGGHIFFQNIVVRMTNVRCKENVLFSNSIVTKIPAANSNFSSLL